MIDHTKRAPEVSAADFHVPLRYRRVLLDSMLDYTESTLCLCERILAYFGDPQADLTGNNHRCLCSEACGNPTGTRPSCQSEDVCEENHKKSRS